MSAQEARTRCAVGHDAMLLKSLYVCSLLRLYVCFLCCWLKQTWEIPAIPVSSTFKFPAPAIPSMSTTVSFGYSSL